MRRIVLVAAGVLLGFLASGLALVLGVLAEALSLPAETSLGLTRLAAALAAALQAGSAGTVVGAGLSVLWTALVAACFVPVCLIATIGEAAQLRSFVWAAGGTGVLTAAMPSLLRSMARLPGGGAPMALESRFTLLLFLAGIAAGATYWLVAGARTGDAR